MIGKYFLSSVLAVTIGTFILLKPFAQNFMSSRGPVLIEANRTPLKVMPDTGADDNFDDDFEDQRNVIRAFQSGKHYDESICFCGFYAEYVRSKLQERVASGEVTREQVEGFCSNILVVANFE